MAVVPRQSILRTEAEWLGSIKADLVVSSGKGVSSSASVEVATTSAIAAAYGLKITPRDLALLCQKVENHVVGAPCGVMDQMTSACGEANKLLAMVCQSDGCKENGMDLLKPEASVEYFCNLPPHRYEAVYAKDITADAFLEKYGDHNDAVTVVDPKRSYSVKAPTRHPIYENFRVETFKALFAAANTDEQLSALGELMYQHRKTAQNGFPTLFGAKITGGGSGGSVSVIGTNCRRSSEEIAEIQQRYKAAMGYLPIVFDGSSPGAGKFGYLKIRRRRRQSPN